MSLKEPQDWAEAEVQRLKAQYNEAVTLQLEARAQAIALREQFDALHGAATKAWALLPVDHQAHEILRDALLALVSNQDDVPASRQEG